VTDGAVACHEALAEPEPEDDDDEDVDGNSTDGAESLASLKDGGIIEPVWRSCRAAIRYVTQKPWKRVPPITRTLIFNPVLACLSGGRNKVGVYLCSWPRLCNSTAPVFHERLLRMCT
jgi:hypothetical protein